ncbi:MAG: hypothetical protein DRQ88_08005 [Epsilonproteobacteria bacterium]|nr:MAG: hypothetical protein DRQ89_05590 [Campylobacterota bacterium]RLA66066.1 MAG: hypothetical protein DRQ88_08005 [Campylobacterota bacterium]
MKKIILVIFLIFPLISFGACIEFSGKFNCSSNIGNFVRSYSTKIYDGTYVYVLVDGGGESMTFYADRSPRPFKFMEQGMKIIGRITSRCDLGALNSYFKGKIEGDSGVVEVKMKSTKARGKIKMVLEIFYNSRLFQTINETCS